MTVWSLECRTESQSLPGARQDLLIISMSSAVGVIVSTVSFSLVTVEVTSQLWDPGDNSRQDNPWWNTKHTTKDDTFSSLSSEVQCRLQDEEKQEMSQQGLLSSQLWTLDMMITWQCNVACPPSHVHHVPVSCVSTWLFDYIMSISCPSFCLLTSPSLTAAINKNQRKKLKKIWVLSSWLVAWF